MYQFWYETIQNNLRRQDNEKIANQIFWLKHKHVLMEVRNIYGI